MFDPYYKWLGIRPEHQPPDHYRLLGVERYESDADVIQAAGERQAAHVQSYKIGQQSELSQRLLNEIARAKVCLLNPRQKKAYDEQLRAAEFKLSPPPAPSLSPPPAPVEMLPPAPVPPVPVEAPPAPVAPDFALQVPRRSMPKRSKHRASAVTIVACLAIIFVLVASTFVFDLSQLTGNKSPLHKQPAQSTAFAKDVDSSRLTSQPGARQQSARPLVEDPRHPLPTPQQRSQAEAAVTIHGESSAADLLRAARKAQHHLTCYILLEKAIEKAKSSPPAQWTAASAVGLEAAREMAARFRVDPLFEPALAQFFAENAPAPSGNVHQPVAHNVEAALPGKTPPDSPSLAKANSPAAESAMHTLPAPRIDLSKAQYDVKFAAPPKCDVRKLQIEAVSISEQVLERRVPDDGVAKHGEPVFLFVRESKPRAGFELSLRGTDPLYVRIKPIVEDFDSKRWAWNVDRIKTLRAKLNRAVADCQQRLTQLQRNIPALRAETEGNQVRARNPVEEQVIRSAKTALKAELSAAETALRETQDELRILERQSQSIDALLELSESMHRGGSIQFRVFQDTGDGTRTIAQTTD